MAKQTITRSTTKNTIRVSYGRDVKPSSSSSSTKSSTSNQTVRAVKPSNSSTRKQTTK